MSEGKRFVVCHYGSKLLDMYTFLGWFSLDLCICVCNRRIDSCLCSEVVSSLRRDPPPPPLGCDLSLDFVISQHLSEQNM